jgi:hypothetical protein
VLVFCFVFSVKEKVVESERLTLLFGVEVRDTEGVADRVVDGESMDCVAFGESDADIDREDCFEGDGALSDHDAECEAAPVAVMFNSLVFERIDEAVTELEGVPVGVPETVREWLLDGPVEAVGKVVRDTDDVFPSVDDNEYDFLAERLDVRFCVSDLEVEKEHVIRPVKLNVALSLILGDEEIVVVRLHNPDCDAVVERVFDGVTEDVDDRCADSDSDAVNEVVLLSEPPGDGVEVEDCIGLKLGVEDLLVLCDFDNVPLTEGRGDPEIVWSHDNVPVGDPDGDVLRSADVESVLDFETEDVGDVENETLFAWLAEGVRVDVSVLVDEADADSNTDGVKE